MQRLSHLPQLGCLSEIICFVPNTSHKNVVLLFIVLFFTCFLSSNQTIRITMAKQTESVTCASFWMPSPGITFWPLFFFVFTLSYFPLNKRASDLNYTDNEIERKTTYHAMCYTPFQSDFAVPARRLQYANRIAHPASFW